MTDPNTSPLTDEQREAVLPTTAKPPMNGIAATLRHGEGAIARCSFCGRYSIDPKTLGDRQPKCECGEQHGWSGSFAKPGPDAKWSGPAPATDHERPAFDAWLAAEYPDVAAAMKNEFTNPDVVESVDMARAAWNRASKGDALVSSRLAALEEENRELAEFVIAVGGFWGESRSKLVGPLSLAEIIKQAMREQVSTPADHCLRAPTICAGVAAAPDEARKTCTCSGLGPCERRTDGSCRVSAPADARDAATFIREVAAQKPEKPDYWSSCGQCQRNAERAQDLLDAACAQSIDLPDSEGGEA